MPEMMSGCKNSECTERGTCYHAKDHERSHNGVCEWVCYDARMPCVPVGPTREEPCRIFQLKSPCPQGWECGEKPCRIVRN